MLGELYSKALVFVSQSIGDSFGLPPLEAMACGTAVVLTDTVGAREYARDGENCFVVPLKNSEKTAEKVKELLKNTLLRNNFEQAGFETVKNYDWNISIEKFSLDIIMRNEN